MTSVAVAAATDTTATTMADLPAPLVEGHKVRGYQVSEGYLVTAPRWSDHKRAKNWLAVIHADPTSPGGLGRGFALRGKGVYMYAVTALGPGVPVEFASDHVSGGGKVTQDRCYAVVLDVSAERLALEICASSAEALKLSKEMREATPPPPPKRRKRTAPEPSVHTGLTLHIGATDWEIAATRAVTGSWGYVGHCAHPVTGEGIAGELSVTPLEAVRSALDWILTLHGDHLDPVAERDEATG